jgi:hypothetical protein
MQLVYVARQYLFNFQRPRSQITLRNEPILPCSSQAGHQEWTFLKRLPTSNFRPTSLPCGVGTGGAGRDRTGDLLNANQALSQLSYSPFKELYPPTKP